MTDEQLRKSEYDKYFVGHAVTVVCDAVLGQEAEPLYGELSMTSQTDGTNIYVVISIPTRSSKR